MRLYAFLLYFLQTALHVSDDTLVHHQDHIQTVITTSGTGQPYLLPSADVEELERSLSSETCTAVCRKYNKTAYSRILFDNY